MLGLGSDGLRLLHLSTEEGGCIVVVLTRLVRQFGAIFLETSQGVVIGVKGRGFGFIARRKLE